MAGTVVARGRLKVDARRAALKLKDHLLSDPATWLCEVVRAATIARAPRVDITHDARDLYVRFAGEPWPADVLDRAAADVDTGRADEDGVRSRRLAQGAIAALGHGARAVTVFVRDAAGVSASRIDAAMLAGDGKEEGSIDPEPPDGLPIESFCLQVRSSALDAAQRLLDSDREEIAALERRLSARAIPVFVNGRALVASSEAAPALRVPLESSWESHLEAHGRWFQPPSIDLYEQGILLAQEPLELGAELASHYGVHAPVRVVVFGDHLPTNVSRSKVKEDVIAQLTATARSAMPVVVDRARSELASAAVDDANRAAVTESLTAIAMLLLRSLAPQREQLDLQRVLQLPLLRDGCGRPQSFEDLARVRSQRVYARRAKEPLPAEATLLVPNTFSVAPGVQERLFGSLQAWPFEELEAHVQDGIERRRRALATPRVPVDIPFDPVRHIAVEHVERADGLRAALAIHRPGVTGQTLLRLHVDGQLLETRALSWQTFAPALDVALEWPNVVVPTYSYEGVDSGEGFSRALADVGAIARELLARYVASATGELDGALTWVIATTILSTDSALLRALPLWRVWENASERRLTSDELRALAQTRPRLPFVAPGDTSSLLRDAPRRPVLLLHPAEVEPMAHFLRGACRLLPYAQWKIADAKPAEAPALPPRKPLPAPGRSPAPQRTASVIPTFASDEGSSVADLVAQLPGVVAPTPTTRRASSLRLDGKPVHPALRATMADLRVPGCFGQIEIVAEPRDFFDLTGPRDEVISGAPIGWSAALGIGVRARLRFETREDVAETLGRALSALLDRAARHAPDLPAFALEALACYVLRRLEEGAPLPDALRLALVFTTGPGCRAIHDFQTKRMVGDVPLRMRSRLYAALDLPDDVPRLEGLDPNEVVARVRTEDFDVAMLNHAKRTPVVVRHCGVEVAGIPQVLGYPVTGALRIARLSAEEASSKQLSDSTMGSLQSMLGAALSEAFRARHPPPSDAVAKWVVDAVDADEHAWTGWVWLSRAAATQLRLFTPGHSATYRLPNRGSGREPSFLGAALFGAPWRTSPAQSLPGQGDFETRFARLLAVALEGLAPSAVAAPAVAPIAAPTAPSPPPGPALSAPAPVTPSPAQPRRRERARPGTPVDMSRVAASPAPPPAAAARATPKRGFVAGLLALFGIEAPVAAGTDDPLAMYLHGVLSRVAVPASTTIGFVGRGRPIRYDKRTSTVVINREHATIQVLIESKDGPSIAAAVLSEVNRDLDNVTDAEELREVLALMSRLP